jgi:hypothetical protein
MKEGTPVIIVADYCCHDIPVGTLVHIGSLYSLRDEVVRYWVKERDRTYITTKDFVLDDKEILIEELL